MNDVIDHVRDLSFHGNQHTRSQLSVSEDASEDAGLAEETYNGICTHIHAAVRKVYEFCFEVAAFLATALLNEGHSALLMVMNELQLVVGSQSLNFVQNTDSQHVTRQNRRTTLKTKETRIARQAEMQAQKEAYELSEGLLYRAGIAD
ncbi:hypothetical protein M0802_009982 [Mischocyttarus mexicanus]|nr:hypothetical protein M0802_009982 [Mischocyttarus mexicanus]